MKKFLIALSALTFIFAVAGCSYFGDEEATEDEVTGEETAVEVEIDEDGKSDEVEGWLTYTHEDWGFSVEYPEEWTAEQDEHGRSFVTITSDTRAVEALEYMDMGGFAAIDARIMLYDSYLDLPNNSDELSFTDWLASEDSYFNGTYTPTTVSGVDAYLIVSSDELLGGEYRFIMLEHEGRIYSINFNVPNIDDYAIERNHMMESFELL